MKPSPVLLMIFDGFGVNPSRLNNGWAQATTPNLDHYFANNPHTVLQASGLAVGLPDGQFGNSEVGHLTLGAGRILEQDLIRIANAFRHDTVTQEQPWKNLLDGAEKIHLIGLISDGGVHSHLEHVLAMLPLIVAAGATPVVHVITDGRDTAPRCAIPFIEKLEAAFATLGKGYIGTLSGRYWAMDRAKNWDRVELAWKAMMLGEGRSAESAVAAVADAYDRDEGDEFIKPYVIGEAAKAVIGAQDRVLFFNFRADRVRQLSAAMGIADFDGFDRGDVGTRSLVTMTQYQAEFPFPVLFKPEYPADVLCEVIARAGKKQFHIAETEKFPHVTYFFNGGIEKPFEGEERLMVPSPDVATYDMKPEMSSPEVADKLIEAIQSGEYDFILVNFANGDMVGHSAEFEAVKQAVAALDREGGRVAEAALHHGFRVMITADHGNCDETIDPVTGSPHTQHSVYPVPFLLLGEKDAKLGIGRGLADVAPTVLQFMGIAQPASMTGKTLILDGSLGV